MTSQADPYQPQLTRNTVRIREMLRSSTPAQVAALLEKKGWRREWACCAVEHVGYQYNPAGLRNHAQVNQKIRDRFQTQFYIGLILFVVGFIVSSLTLANALAFGGLVIFAYGSVISGAGMALRASKILKTHPDRPLPKYFAPRDPVAYSPGDY